MTVSNGTHADSGERLQALLDDPENVAALEDALTRLPELTATIDLISNFLAGSSRIAENANGIINTARESMAGVDMPEQVERMKRLAATGNRVAEELGDPLSDPELMASMRELLEMLPRLVALLKVFEMFLANSSRFAENVNSIVTTARRAAEDKWPELTDRQGLLSLPQQLLDVVNSPALTRLLESQVLSDGALHVMDQVAGATVEAHAKAVDHDVKVSAWGAFKALGDPDVQRGLGFTIALSRAIGRRMKDQPHPTPSSQERPKHLPRNGA